MRQLAIVPVVLLVACGEDGGSSPPVDAKTIDARLIDAPAVDAPPDGPPIDSPPPTVFAVACTGTPPIVTAPGVFDPMTTTISVGDMVRFNLSATPNHNVVPDTTLPTDTGLQVPLGGDVCLQFTVAGTFNFKCGPHSFKGSVTVQ
ncbi:MAG: hypothetical protein SFX73_10850 [Kofleriaceae bacterium]|nr:hypothetical protein [Kofleriaceae bacterium]